MGISTNYYTVYGIKGEFNDEFCEAYDNVYYEDGTPAVLIDSMSGEYIVFGTILFDSGDQRYNELGDTFVEIDIDTLPDIEIDYKKSFIAKFPQFASLMDASFKLMTFVHYT
jgi:hypothetical protein